MMKMLQCIARYPAVCWFVGRITSAFILFIFIISLPTQAILLFCDSILSFFDSINVFNKLCRLPTPLWIVLHIGFYTFCVFSQPWELLIKVCVCACKTDLTKHFLILVAYILSSQELHQLESYCKINIVLPPTVNLLAVTIIEVY